MAKRNRKKQRAFRPQALRDFAVPGLRPRMGPGETVWRFTVTVPLEEIEPKKRQKATADDLDNLQQVFAAHFGGCARLPPSPGYGLRNPARPDQQPEMNYNTYFVVLTSPISEPKTISGPSRRSSKPLSMRG